MRAVLFAAGEVYHLDRVRQLVGEPDLVICADGGLRHAAALGLTPDLVVGDFDSADPQLLADAEQSGWPILRLPVEKDKTDSQVALEEAVRRGATEVLLVGGSGSRIDHTLSNLLMLPGSPVPVTLTDGQNIARVLQRGQAMRVEAQPGSFLSLVPLSPVVTGVCVSGVHWPLTNATLRWGESIGVSNRIAAETATVSAADGCLLVVQAWD